MTDLVPVRRALLSVSDKAGLADLAAALVRHGVELVSTGGTAKALRDAGHNVLDVADLTGFPEMMDGRVKTLHPTVHGGILAVRDDAAHVAAMEMHSIGAIDLVVVNLYPFLQTMLSGADRNTIIENIDIGGPAMVRSSAKNHAFVNIVTEPEDYAAVIAEMDANGGATTLALRKRLAATAFAHTATYDSMIARWFAIADQGKTFPDTLPLTAKLASELRYGENPHQKAALYVPAIPGPRGIAGAEQVQGKELSYNNINDADAALELVAEFREADPTCVIVKHANPCGVATAATIAEAYDAALKCDDVSAFGGIIAVNRPLDGATAEAISGIFTEVVCAPDADADARAVFAKKKNLRLLLTGELPDPARGGLVLKGITGGWLVQSRDNGQITRADLKIVTDPRADRGRTGRRAVRVDDRQACEIERDRLCQGRLNRGHRRRSDESPRQRAHRGGEGARSGGIARLGQPTHRGQRGGERCLLPLCRRLAGGGRGGGDLRHPAGRIDPRR